MSTVAIISEYNPLHNGHVYHIKRSMELTGADTVICIMSGNFVQRGEPAIIDKWNRAAMAVDAGVSLVIELPFAWACNSAEYFALGAINIANGLGCVDYLSFGSECGDIEMLKTLGHELAAVEYDEDYKVKLKEYMGSGISYPKAVRAYIANRLGNSYAQLMDNPNNTLGIQYIKALELSGSSIKPFTVMREGAGYNSSEAYNQYASATGIRKMLCEGLLDKVKGYIPDAVCDSLFGKVTPEKSREVRERMKAVVFSKIAQSSPEYIDAIASAGEGIGFKFCKEFRKAGSVEELVNLVGGSRYTSSRIRRVVCQLLVGLVRMDMEMFNDCLYARVLGFDIKGASMLRKMSKIASIPVITNINKTDTSAIDTLLKMDIKATDIYNVINGAELYSQSDYVRKPYIKK